MVLVPQAIVEDPVAGIFVAEQVGTIQLDELTPVPFVVVTDMTPEPAAPAVAVICVVELTVKEPTETPPTLTAEAPVKLVPVITIVEELAHPPSGEKSVIVGAAQVPE